MVNKVKPEEDALLTDAASSTVELTEADKRALEAEAKKEVEAELREQKRKEFKANAKRRLKKQALFQDGKDETGEDLIEITLDLAPQQPHIQLDGKRYYHGHKYNLTRPVVQVLKEQEYRGWREESHRRGDSEAEFYGVQHINKRGGFLARGLRAA